MSTAPLTSHTPGVATAPPTQGAQPYDSGVPSPSSLEAQGFSEDDPKPKPGVLGPETMAEPVLVGEGSGGKSVVVYQSKDKPVQDENSGEDDKRRIAELEKDLSELGAKFEQELARREFKEQQLAQYKKLALGDIPCAKCGYRAMARGSSDKRVGYALLLFNTFKGGRDELDLEELEWAESEAKVLKEVLEELGYDVMLVYDTNRERMFSELRRIETQVKGSDRHVLVFLSTHGGCTTEGAFIQDNDGVEIFEIERSLCDNILLGACKEKSIFVFIDTCRGDNTRRALPENMNIFYSTTYGYAAHEGSSYGSPFVMAMCGELLQCFRYDSVFTIMRRVSSRVMGEKLKDYDDRDNEIPVRQVPDIQMDPRDHLYFSAEAEQQQQQQAQNSDDFLAE